jgi:hypothetical protein
LLVLLFTLKRNKFTRQGNKQLIGFCDSRFGPRPVQTLRSESK